MCKVFAGQDPANYDFETRSVRLMGHVTSVRLEAGGRHEIADFQNDEWGSFVQISWLDPRTTSGNWRVAKDFAGLPAWIVKAVGGSTVHWAGASLRFQDHEWKARSAYGDIPGANLLDWPIDAAMMAPWYAMAEDRMDVTRTHGIPGLTGNNNFKVMKKGADKLGYTQCSTGRMAINSEPRDGVVNRWGRTHDLPNLFISDGSQFTTGAAENPTLTIVALALRQADHIASEMSRGTCSRRRAGGGSPLPHAIRRRGRCGRRRRTPADCRRADCRR